MIKTSLETKIFEKLSLHDNIQTTSVTAILRPPFQFDMIQRTIESLESAKNEISPIQDLEILICTPEGEGEDYFSDEQIKTLNSYQSVALVHIESTPSKWKSSCHQLYRSLAKAKNEWILLVNPEVEFKKEGIEKLVRYGMENKLCLVNIFPKIKATTFRQKTFLGQFFYEVLPFLPISKMEDRRSPQSFASTNLLLLRREEFAAIEGEDPVAYDLFEGLAIGRRLKLHCKTQEFIVSHEDFVHPLEKSKNSLLEQFRQSLAGSLAVEPGFVFMIATLQMLWFVGFFILPWFVSERFQIVFGVAILIHILATSIAYRSFKIPFWPILWLPLSFLWIRWRLLRSVSKIRKHGYLDFHDQKLPIDQLRYKQSLKLADLMKLFIIQ